MVSLFNFSFFGIILFFIIVVQAKPLVESSDNSEDNKSSKNNQQQLYELYKAMRTDPRLASVSNHDIILYIYRNFGNNNDIDSIKQKSPNQKQKAN